MGSEHHDVSGIDHIRDKSPPNQKVETEFGATKFKHWKHVKSQELTDGSIQLNCKFAPVLSDVCPCFFHSSTVWDMQARLSWWRQPSPGQPSDSVSRNLSPRLFLFFYLSKTSLISLQLILEFFPAQVKSLEVPNLAEAGPAPSTELVRWQRRITLFGIKFGTRKLELKHYLGGHFPWKCCPEMK